MSLVAVGLAAGCVTAPGDESVGAGLEPTDPAAVCAWIEAGVAQGVLPPDGSIGEDGTASADDAAHPTQLDPVRDGALGEVYTARGLIQSDDDVDWFSVSALDEPIANDGNLPLPWAAYFQPTVQVRPMSQQLQIGTTIDQRLQVCAFFIGQDGAAVVPHQCWFDGLREDSLCQTVPGLGMGVCTEVGGNTGRHEPLSLWVGWPGADSSGTFLFSVRGQYSGCGPYQVQYAAHAFAENAQCL